MAPATAYYWLKRGKAAKRGDQSRTRSRREAGQTTTTFARAVPSSAAHATIAVRIGGAEVQVQEGFDGDLLRAMVTALQEGAP